MRLLKIGTLNVPRDRWIDALDVFSEIHVACFSTEIELNNPGFVYHKIQVERGINNYLYRLILHTDKKKILDIATRAIIFAFRLFNSAYIRELKGLNCDQIHSSYNDFDESALLTSILGLKNNYTRAQKETRLSYSYLEYSALRNAKRIVLNDKVNLELFKRKYREIDNLNIVFNLDEDVRRENLSQHIQYAQKLSSLDGKIHAVILAGRVLSNPKDSRSGGRLYYIPMIERMLDNNIVVHLHTKSIEEFEGNNPYEEIRQNNSNFHIERSLDFDTNIEEAYYILSKYDIGILHAHIENEEVTEFDKINLPHRYYEYEIAHVLPIEIKGTNVLIEKKAEAGYTKVYTSLDELTLDSVQNDNWDTPGFKDYIRFLYVE